MLTILRWLFSKAGWLLVSFVVVVAMLALWNELPSKFKVWRAEAETAQAVAVGLSDAEGAFASFAADELRKADSEIA